MDAGAANPASGSEEPLPAGPVVAAVAGLGAGWLASGAAGLMGHPLRHGLTWLAFGVAIAAAWRGGERLWPRLLTVLAGLVVAVAMTASGLLPVNVVAPAVLLAALAVSRAGRERGPLVAAAFAVAVLGVYRLLLTSVPAMWLTADWAGRWLGTLAGGVTGRPLWVGATFAGLDVLVSMAALYGLWLALTPRPRWRRAACAALAILGVHVVYLLALTAAPGLLAALPEPEAEGGWSLAAAARSLVPWNLPALAVLLHLAVAAALLRWAPPSLRRAAAGRPLVRVVLGVAAAIVALALPVLTTLPIGRASLEGKTIVVFEEGFLNWEQPEHGDYGRLAIGMYGLLPTYVESLGATCVRSPDLGAEDLADADALILLYPNEPWTPEQLDRIWAFVRGGGTLLVFGEHTILEEPAAGETPRERGPGRGRYVDSRFNEVLAPTAMAVRFDSATFAVGGWLHSYEPLAHPATAGIGDRRNQFGVVIGASVEAHFPARPLLAGRWGWADPGDPGSGAAMMGNHRYDGGEKLGDLVLAAEQRLGKGRVIAFGDTSSMTNGITVGAHPFTSRLLAYAAGGVSSPQEPWGGVVGLVLGAALVAMLALHPGPRRIGLVAAFTGVSLVLCAAAAGRSALVLPDGRRQQPNNLAYLDTAHVGAQSDESWRPDGTAGLTMTLMRNGYLALDLPELTRARLERAGLLVTIAPARAYSASERRLVRRWVEDGGIFIITVGWDHYGASRALLADLGFRVGPPDGEPRPLGHFKSPYIQTEDGYRAHVRFHAAWPVDFALCEGEARFAANHIRDWPRFRDVLVQLAEQAEGTLGHRIWSLLPAAAQQAVRESADLDPVPGAAQQAILDGLNALLSNPKLYAKHRFADLDLPDEAQALLERGMADLSDAEVLRLNRLLLEAAFGRHVARSRQVVAYGRGDTQVILLRRLGSGKVVLVGDTGFAMNKNLERKDGRPFEGMRENADFWRWLLTLLRDQPAWVPPNPEKLQAPAEGEQP